MGWRSLLLHCANGERSKVVLGSFGLHASVRLVDFLEGLVEGKRCEPSI